MRRVLVIAAVLLAVAVGALVRLDGLFVEPEAQRIDSLAAELGMQTLLCVFAHPDDEVLAAGALEDATRRGVRVHMITVTRGEKGTTDVSVSGAEELGRGVNAAQQTVELVQVLYRTGLVDFLNVLDAERSLFEAQDQLLESKGRVAKNLVRVYRALGGGWTP